MATVSIEIEGLDELRRKLGQNIEPALQGAMMAAAAELQNLIAPYPPESVANRPNIRSGQTGSPRWYERGYGTRWLRLVKGGYGGNPTSEMLNRQWSIAKLGRTGAQLRNRASYAKYVHGEKDQPAFHAGRGWKTEMWGIRQILNNKTIERMVKAALMARFGR